MSGIYWNKVKKLLRAHKIKRFFRLFLYNKGLSHKKIFHKKLAILHDKFFSGELSNSKIFQKRCCVICGLNDFQFLFTTPANFDFMKCNICGMVIMNPIPTPECLDKLYNSEDMAFNLGGASIHEDVQPKGEDDLKFTTKYIDSGRLLDIGTGGGGFLLNARKCFICEGVEINSIHAEKAKNAGLTIHNIYSNDFDPSYKFDIVTMLQVIEHLPDPNTVIEDAYRLLKNEGYLYIACPNYESKSMEIFKEKHRHVSTFGHINLYSPKSLLRSIEKNGFNCVDITTYSSDIELHDLFYFYLKNKNFSHRMANYNPSFFQLFTLLYSPFRKKFDKKIISKNKGSYVRAIFIKQRNN